MTENELYHHGVLGMKWGVRRYQNKDGSLTEAGKKQYAKRIRLIPNGPSKLRKKDPYKLRDIQEVQIYEEDYAKKFRESSKVYKEYADAEKKLNDMRSKAISLDMQASKQARKKYGLGEDEEIGCDEKYSDYWSLRDDIRAKNGAIAAWKKYDAESDKQWLRKDRLNDAADEFVQGYLGQYASLPVKKTNLKNEKYWNVGDRVRSALTMSPETYEYYKKRYNLKTGDAEKRINRWAAASLSSVSRPAPTYAALHSPNGTQYIRIT